MPPSPLRVLLTGASSGIGHALAVELLRRHAHVLLLARRREPLDALAAIWNPPDAAPHAVVVSGDITDPDVRQRALQTAVQTFGGLDVLVCNAGIGAHGPFQTSEETVLRRLFEVDFFAPVSLLKESISLLQRSRSPSVVFVDSILGYWGIPHMSGYCAAKFALRGFSESVRGELQDLGIHLLSVTPGSTTTPFHDNAIERHSPPVTGGKLATSPEYVANQIVLALQRRRRHLTPGIAAQCSLLLARLFPQTFRRIAAHVVRKRTRNHSE